MLSSEISSKAQNHKEEENVKDSDANLTGINNLGRQDMSHVIFNSAELRKYEI